MKAGIGFVAALLLSGCAGMGSPTLRNVDGKLAPCERGPHCVSSQETQPDRYIAPLRYTGPQKDAQGRLATAVRALPNASIVTDTPGYLHATVTSNWMSFVDDVELVFGKDGVVDVRSSSRIGYYDFGVNRKRVEAIRAAFGPYAAP